MSKGFLPSMSIEIIRIASQRFDRQRLERGDRLDQQFAQLFESDGVFERGLQMEATKTNEFQRGGGQRLERTVVENVNVKSGDRGGEKMQQLEEIDVVLQRDRQCFDGIDVRPVKIGEGRSVIGNERQRSQIGIVRRGEELSHQIDLEISGNEVDLNAFDVQQMIEREHTTELQRLKVRKVLPIDSESLTIIGENQSMNERANSREDLFAKSTGECQRNVVQIDLSKVFGDRSADSDVQVGEGEQHVQLMEIRTDHE